MPIYEYRCSGCRKPFELLVRSDTKIRCPDCGSERVSRQFSVFASHIGRSGSSSPGCYSGKPGCDLGKCGSGFCGVD